MSTSSAISTNCQPVATRITAVTASASMRSAGTFPIVLAAANDVSVIRLNAADNVTSPDGTNGMSRIPRTRNHASTPLASRRRLKRFPFGDVYVCSARRYSTKLMTAPTASPTIETVTPRPKPRTFTFSAVKNALGNTPATAMALFKTILITTNSGIGSSSHSIIQTPFQKADPARSAFVLFRFDFIPRIFVDRWKVFLFKLRYNDRTRRVTRDVDGRTEHVEDTVDPDDEGDPFDRQVDRL